MSRPGSRRRRLEAGAAAVEFALVFPVFFLIVYGIVHYGLIFALQQSLTLAAEEGARAVLAVDTTGAQAEWEATMDTQARSAVSNSLAWLPAETRSQVLGDSNELIGVDFTVGAGGEDIVQISVNYANYVASPLLPVLSMPFLGIDSVPPVPDQFGATARTSVETN